MQAQSKSLWQIIPDGGVWMLPFLFLTLWWLILLVRAIRSPASLGKGLMFLLFPVGFGLIALAKTVSFLHEMFHVLAMTGRLRF